MPATLPPVSAYVGWGLLHVGTNSAGTYNSTSKIFFVGDQPPCLHPTGDVDIPGSKPASLCVTIKVTAGGTDAAGWAGPVAAAAKTELSVYG